MALELSGSINISGSMTATTIIVSAPGAPGMVSSSNQLVELNTATGSLIGITNGLMGVTASLNLKTGSYATTGSNTFIGNQSITGSLRVTGSLKVGDWQHGEGIANTAKLDIRTASDRGLKIEGAPSADIYITSYRGASDDMVRGMVLQGNAVNFYIGDGNANTGSYVAQFNTNGLAFENGKGIDFSATSEGGGTMTSELLNDYEEGTWTATLNFGGASVGMTYGQRTGNYTKVGRQVSATVYIELSAKGSSTGNAIVTGFPFTNGSAVRFLTAGAIRTSDISYTGMMDGFLRHNTTDFELFDITEAGTSANLDNTNFSNSSTIMISVTYFV
jgi:hypothetical protein